MLFLGNLITIIAFIGVPLFLLLSIIQLFRGRPAKRFLKIGLGLIPVLIIGIAIAEFATPSYWEKDQQTAAQAKEEQKIQENINRNLEKMEEQQKKNAQAEHESVAASISGPEERKTAAKTINYASIQKDPNKYIGTYMKFEGTIVEVRDVQGGGVGSMIALDVGNGNLVRVRTMIPSENKRGDHITAFGTLTGTITYTDNNGKKLTAPSITADLVE